METKEDMRQSDESQQMIDENYIESVIKDRHLLLICLNRLLRNECILHSKNVLIQIYCNHFDDYVKYISAKLIINYIIEGQLSLKMICQSEYWHCLPQMCQFLIRMSSRAWIGQSLHLESIICELNSKLNQFSDNLCEDHCFCYVCETMSQIICVTKDEKINQLLLKLIQLFPKQENNRCFVYKLIDLMITTIRKSGENPVSVQTVCIWVFQQNFFTERIKISNNFYGFGGKCLSEYEVKGNEWLGCDVVLLRQSVLLYLMALSSDFVMKSTDYIIKDRLNIVTDFVRNKCERFDENDWIIRLFIEEDEQLLSSIYCLICLGDNQLSHFSMNAFIESIDCDSSVLLDMLCDEQTATLLLKLLLIFLKLSDISTNISINVKNVLLELIDKIQRLTAKQLFPYNVNPLMKLLNKLKD